MEDELPSPFRDGVASPHWRIAHHDVSSHHQSTSGKFVERIVHATDGGIGIAQKYVPMHSGIPENPY